ncbi:MAG: hypothetical protein OEZ34_15780, partial [Spirochaetia bacterium]|nr:hypothetical protein [Spirochaetia bacterium]
MTTDRIRKKIFERILLVGLFLFPALIPLTYSLGYSLLALSEILYACFLIFSVIALKKNLIPSNFLMNFVAVSSFLFICGVALFVDVIFIYWIYLFPAMIYYILGLKR